LKQIVFYAFSIHLLACPLQKSFDDFFLLANLAWFHKTFEFGLYGCLYRAIKYFT
jgi:hypothetical protein